MSQAEYTRIGGWLLAPLAYLIVTLLSASLMLLLYAMAIFMPESRDYLLTNAQSIYPAMVLFGADHAFDVGLHPVAGVSVLPALAALPQAVLVMAADHGNSGGESLRLRAGAG